MLVAETVGELAGTMAGEWVGEKDVFEVAAWVGMLANWSVDLLGV
jgi:hypothetical protein